MKSLDLADKYDPLSYSDEYMEGHVDSTPTIKVQMIPFLPKVIVSDEGEEEDDTWGERDTIPCPPPYPQPYERKGVNVPAIAVLLATLAFWGGLAYLLFF